MMRSCMTKCEFLPKPNIFILRLGKIPLICCLFCIEFSQSLLMPYERFVMLLKSRSRTHQPHMHYSYTGGRRKNMPFHLDPPKKLFYSYTRSKHQKYTLKDIPQINAPKFLLLSLKSFVAEKKHVAMQKLFIKQERVGKEWHNITIVFGKDPQIPHILRDLRVSYNGSSEFYFENLQKHQNTD